VFEKKKQFNGCISISILLESSYFILLFSVEMDPCCGGEKSFRAVPYVFDL
jgi:hypothetical protein